MVLADKLTKGVKIAPRIPVNISTSKIGKPKGSIRAKLRASG